MHKLIVFFLILVLVTSGMSQIPRPSRRLPDQVEILLTSKIYNLSRQPLLRLSCLGARDSRGWASELLIDQVSYPDSLVLDIRGFEYADFTKLFEEKNYIISPTIQKSKKDISIPLEAKEKKKVVIYLQDQKNVFYLERNNLLVVMDSVEIKNIKIREHPVKSTAEAILFPRDVYVLYLIGQFNSSVDYLSLLIDFGHDFGLTLAKEKYPQIPIGFRENSIYCAVPEWISNKPARGRSLRLGTLSEFPEIKVYMRTVTSFGDDR